MKKKINWQIVIPIIIALIIVGVAFYIDYSKRAEKPGPDVKTEKPGKKLKPVHPSENPRREEDLGDLGIYGCASPATIKPETIGGPDEFWKINKSKRTNRISLGKYRINNPAITVLEIPKLWLYFFSDALSREDGMYGLEESYTSGITLIVNGQKRELNLGGDNYMFIELDDYPLGDLYPYDKKYSIEFEFIIELKCKNFENGNCYDNKGEILDYINGADIKSQIRIFALGCQDFTHDMLIESKFKYGE